MSRTDDNDVTPDHVDDLPTHDAPYVGPTTTLTLEREFRAAPGGVFRAFLDPGMLSDWFGAAGSRVERDSVQLVPVVGGVLRFMTVHVDDPSVRVPVAARFIDLDEPHHLALVQFTGPTTLTLEIDLDPTTDGCRLRLRQHPHPAATLDGARQAWFESFDKLDRALEVRAR